MRLFSCVFFIVLTEARNKEPRLDYEEELSTALQKKIDIYPPHFEEPVPFGHITREGIGDPFSPVKLPLDLLELDMITPQNSKEARELLKKGRKNIQFIRNPYPEGYVSPREKFLNEIVVMPPPENQNGTHLKWYNLAEIQARNAMMSVHTKNREPKNKNPNYARITPAPPSNYKESKLKHFATNKFQLNKENADIKVNWTSCDEFGIGAFFSPKEIVNLEWVPFYIWSLRGYRYAIVHKFVYPTKKIVTEYRTNYGKYLNKTVDWNQPKLLMTGMAEMLLIAADRKGLFDALTKLNIPEAAKSQPVKLPSLSIRLKIEDPYLVMTFCEDFFATVMAVAGSGPIIFREMNAEAATIKFVGLGQPVWRDVEGEREIKLAQQQRGKPEEETKQYRIEEETPLVSGFD